MFRNLISPSIYIFTSFCVSGGNSLSFPEIHGCSKTYTTLYLSEIPRANNLLIKLYALYEISYFSKLEVKSLSKGYLTILSMYVTVVSDEL